MSLVSLHWCREYNTSGKIPDNWHEEFSIMPLYLVKLEALSIYFYPEYIQENIKGCFRFPLPKRPIKRKPHLYIAINGYYGTNGALFI